MRQKHILVIDDEIEIRNLFDKFLTEKGYRVSIAATPEKAYWILDNVLTDLVLLDLIFPNVNGLDILTEMQKRHPNLPVLIVSGAGYDEEVVQAVCKSGAAGLVSKGLTLDQLLMEVHRVLHHPAKGQSLGQNALAS